MLDDVRQLERRLDTFTFEIYGFGPRLDDLQTRLSQSPAAVGFRSLRREIADLRWRFVTLPRLVQNAAVALNATLGLGSLGLMLV